MSLRLEMLESAVSKPIDKSGNSLLDFDVRIVAEKRTRLGDVREGDRHVPGL